MHRIRPRTCVLSGAAIGLLAGAAVYGVVAPARPVATKAATHENAAEVQARH